MLFQILKDDAGTVLHSICQQIWKSQQWPQDWKRSIFIPIPKKGSAKECSNYCTISDIFKYHNSFFLGTVTFLSCFILFPENAVRQLRTSTPFENRDNETYSLSLSPAPTSLSYTHIHTPLGRKAR